MFYTPCKSQVASRNNDDDDARRYFAAVSANTSLGIHLGREEALLAGSPHFDEGSRLNIATISFRLYYSLGNSPRLEAREIPANPYPPH